MATAPPDELLALDAEPGHFAFFAWRNVTIVVWEAGPDVPAVARLARVGAERTRKYPGALCDVHVIAGKVALPSAETRNAMAEASRSAVDHLVAVAVVLGGSGFWASAVRSFITGLHVLLRGSFELRLVGRVEEVGEWLPQALARRTGELLDAAALTRALLDAQERALTLHTRRAF